MYAYNLKTEIDIYNHGFVILFCLTFYHYISAASLEKQHTVLLHGSTVIF